MRRFVALLLAVLLPLQWGWAVAAATCMADAHASVAAAGPAAHGHDPAHLGHHVHGPAVTVAADASAPVADLAGGAEPALPVVDCAACHLPVAVFVAPVVALPQARPGESPGLAGTPAVPEPPLQRPFRPPMTRA